MSMKLENRVRLRLGNDIAMGPGKADLLDAIAATGSISAAARQMNMSYRRAWLLVDAMNRCFRAPLVHSAVGGQQGGGATVTPEGHEVLRHFRAMERSAQQALQEHLAFFDAVLRTSAS